MWWTGLILSFLSTLAYSMLFNIPMRTLLVCGLTGLLGWALFTSLSGWGLPDLLCTFAAATFVSLVSQIASMIQKVPSTNYSVAGVIPLVPGSMAYRAMLSFVKGDHLAGITLGVQTMFAAGAIAAGLVLGLVLIKLWKGFVVSYARRKRANVH
jgi:uncharacterized membrane protein YjjB (DUF3815 family)